MSHSIRLFQQRGQPKSNENVFIGHTRMQCGKFNEVMEKIHRLSKGLLEALYKNVFENKTIDKNKYTQLHGGLGVNVASNEWKGIFNKALCRNDDGEVEIRQHTIMWKAEAWRVAFT